MARKKSKSSLLQKGKHEDVLVNLLKNVVGYVAGSEAAGIVDLLSGRKNVNEFAIADKLKITINQTRNILYKLSDEGLVSFVRKKDKKNGGWYTYFWTLEAGKSIENLQRMINSKIDELESSLKNRMHDRFYYCPNCDLEYSEEQALQNTFSCVECGGVLQLRDNKEIIDNLHGEISRLKRDLEIVEQEYGKIAKKEEATISRKARAEERKKKVEREQKRKEREVERKKEQKKAEKIKKKTKSKKTRNEKRRKKHGRKHKSRKSPHKRK